MNIHKKSYSSDTMSQRAYYYIDAVSLRKRSSPPPAPAATLQMSQSTARFYPDPMRDHATIVFPNEDHNVFSLCVYDMFGRLVKELPGITGTEARVERSDLPTGMYAYILTAAEAGIVYRGRFSAD